MAWLSVMEAPGAGEISANSLNTLRRDYGLRRSSFLFIVLFAIGGCARSEDYALDLAAKAQVQADSGRLAEARRSIAEALATHDDVPALYIEKGRIELATGAYQAAFAAYLEASALDTTNFEALQAIARLGLNLGYERDAQDAADRILVLRPLDPDALLVAGLLSLRHRKPDEAARFARRILQKNALDERGLVLDARTKFYTGDAAAAIAILKRAAPNGALGDAATETLLEIDRSRADATGMAEQFTRLRVSRPADMRLRIDEANLLYKIGSMAKARTILRDALGRPNVPAIALRRATGLWIAYDSASFTTGGAGLGEALPASFRDTDARRSIVRFLLDQGQPLAAEHVLGAPRSLPDQALSARIAVARGRPEGVTAAGRIAANDRTQCDALLAMAASQTHGSDSSGAVTLAQRAVAECPADDGTHLQLAEAERAAKNEAGEFRALDAGLSANPQSITIARVYVERALQAGRPDLAMAAARRFTRSAPSVPMGWDLLTRACRSAQDNPCASNAKVGRERSARNFHLDPMAGDVTDGGLLSQSQS